MRSQLTITPSGSTPVTVVISLGANLDSPSGPPEKTFTAALVELEQLAVAGVTHSGFYRTRPVDCPPDSPEFLNAAAVFQVEACQDPESILKALQNIEAHYGRQRPAGVNAPRSLDLDLIGFGDRVMTGVELTLPHPRAHEREFVLAPLAEIAPDLKLPGWPEPAQKLLQLLQQGHEPGASFGRENDAIC